MFTPKPKALLYRAILYRPLTAAYIIIQLGRKASPAVRESTAAVGQKSIMRVMPFGKRVRMLLSGRLRGRSLLYTQDGAYTASHNLPICMENQRLLL